MLSTGSMRRFRRPEGWQNFANTARSAHRKAGKASSRQRSAAGVIVGERWV
jgi:hypothetical protein